MRVSPAKASVALIALVVVLAALGWGSSGDFTLLGVADGPDSAGSTVVGTAGGLAADYSRRPVAHVKKDLEQAEEGKKGATVRPSIPSAATDTNDASDASAVAVTSASNVAAASPVQEASRPHAYTDHRRFVFDNTTGALRGNGRCIVPLLLTDAKYHGTRLLSTTIKGWIARLFTSQRELDLVIYYDVTQRGLLGDIVQMLSLTPSPHAAEDSALAASVRPEALAELPEEDRAVLGLGGYFRTPHDAAFRLRLLPTVVPLPLYVQKEPELLNRSDWRRCGCPPYCPAKQATVGYIQGTRWYTYDLFHEPAVAPYSYWMKVDVDIWVFRDLNMSIVGEMRRAGALVGHTGLAYNGGGCSNDLHRALLEHHGCSYDGLSGVPQGRRPTVCDDGRIVSANSSWWKQDDGVYYTNFVVYSVPFFLDKSVMALHSFLNEYRDGFFRWRWTDQSLAHKVLGVFAGPDEDSFRLDWSYLRWKRGSYRAKAAFWHGKSGKGRKDLRKYTDL